MVDINLRPHLHCAMTVGAEHDITDANCRAWNAQRYEAWLFAFESPKAEAAKIIADPERILRRLSPYLGQVAQTNGFAMCKALMGTLQLPSQLFEPR